MENSVFIRKTGFLNDFNIRIQFVTHETVHWQHVYSKVFFQILFNSWCFNSISHQTFRGGGKLWTRKTNFTCKNGFFCLFFSVKFFTQSESQGDLTLCLLDLPFSQVILTSGRITVDCEISVEMMTKQKQTATFNVCCTSENRKYDGRMRVQITRIPRWKKN